jgi:hypothetical protein
MGRQIWQTYNFTLTSVYIIKPGLAEERLDFADNAPSRKAAALLSRKFNITLAV